MQSLLPWQITSHRPVKLLQPPALRLEGSINQCQGSRARCVNLNSSLPGKGSRSRLIVLQEIDHDWSACVLLPWVIGGLIQAGDEMWWVSSEQKRHQQVDSFLGRQLHWTWRHRFLIRAEGADSSSIGQATGTTIVSCCKMKGKYLT